MAADLVARYNSCFEGDCVSFSLIVAWGETSKQLPYIGLCDILVTFNNTRELALTLTVTLVKFNKMF